MAALRLAAALPLAGPVPSVGELSLLALGLVSVGLVAAHRLGVVHRLRTSAEQRAVERAIADPDDVDASDVDALLDALDALAAHARTEDAGPPPVEPERVRRALNAVREVDPDAFAERVDRLAEHLQHRSTPVRVAVTVAVAELAREVPDEVWPHAAAYETLLADRDPTVRQNAVWAFRWLAREYAASLADVAPAILDRYDDPNPDVRANVVTFCTEFAHDAPAAALSVPGIEARLRLLAASDTLDREIRQDALLTADYVKSLRLDPAVEPADGTGTDDAPEPGDEVALVVAEADYVEDEPVVRGPLGGLDVRVTDPPEGLGPLHRVRVSITAVDEDEGTAEAAFVEAPA